MTVQDQSDRQGSGAPSRTTTASERRERIAKLLEHNGRVSVTKLLRRAVRCDRRLDPT